MIDSYYDYYPNKNHKLFLKVMEQNLQSLSLTLGPVHCGCISAKSDLDFLKSLPKKYSVLVQEVEIQIMTELYRHPHIDLLVFLDDFCIIWLTSLFDEIKDFRNLRKLIFTGPKEVVDDGSLANSNVLQDTICELKELQTLGLHSVGPYEVQRLLSCLPNTLKELNLCENDITDQNMTMIAMD